MSRPVVAVEAGRGGSLLPPVSARRRGASGVGDLVFRGALRTIALPPPPPRAGESLTRSLQAGLRHVMDAPRLRSATLLAGVASFPLAAVLFSVGSLLMVGGVIAAL